MKALPQPLDDGLETPEVGAWSEDKYRIVSLYATLFSSGMKNKWDTRVYVDLYSGAGHVRVKDTQRLLFGSPLLAIQVQDSFEKYVFCEENPARMKALAARTKRLAPQADVSFIEGNCDDRIKDILKATPRPSKEQTVLSLCFVDPFDLGIRFETLAALAERFTDFLVLLALHMDANRNYEHYVDEKSTKVARFLGDPKWRDRWRLAQMAAISFPMFLADAFAARMEGLGYLPPPRMKIIRLNEKNVPLYHLAIFSRNPRAYEFWGEVLKYSTDQLGLF
ncbi:MAG: three-Cys-motif partner protein TcmP [Terriglobia bacterium]